jgi:hypothetical protein
LSLRQVLVGYSDFVLRCAPALRACKMGSGLQLYDIGIGWIGGCPEVVRALARDWEDYQTGWED